MRSYPVHHAVFAILWLIAGNAGTVIAEDARKSEDGKQASAVSGAEPQKTQRAVERALEFMVKDAAKWRADRGCATCHHGTMTVWALNEAASRGYGVDAKALAEITQWTKDQFVPRMKKPRDPRPGWNLVNTPVIYLGLMSQTLPVLSRDELNQLASHLARHQEEDGSWMAPPPSNGSPPTWESAETLALLAYMAWEPYVPNDPEEGSAARAAREKTADWLSKATPTNTAQSMALRLLLDIRTGKPATELQSKIDQIFSHQNSDGGWSQTTDMPSDAYATGQTLWALRFAGLNSERAEIRRAVEFLVTTQREDGSWPMTSRNHPGVKSTRNPIRNPIPITYFGSAWATLGLVRNVPPLLDLAERQKMAFDALRKFAGTHEVDDKSPDKPVVSVKVIYELDDEDLAGLAGLLTAFPQLATLKVKSPRISDAGLKHLKRLPELRKLSLETAAITDAGLMQLQTLTYLEELNLKGTKVTNAGVEEFKKAMPETKIER